MAGWVIKELKSQRGLVLDPVVPLFAELSTKVEPTTRIHKHHGIVGVEGVESGLGWGIWGGVEALGGPVGGDQLLQHHTEDLVATHEAVELLASHQS